MSIAAGLVTHMNFEVGQNDTAVALGSGSLPVLGTPRLLAWCEAATCAAVAAGLHPDETTVGTTVMLEHVAPSSVGTTITVTATITKVDGPRITFAVTAHDDRETELAHGQVTRAVVNTQRFLSRLS